MSVAAALGTQALIGVSPAHAAETSRAPIDLGVLPGGTFSDAYTINDRGVVMGVAIPADGAEQAASWDRKHRITGLGTLPGMDRSDPKGINDRGTVVGDAFPDPGYFRQAVKWDSRGRIAKLAAVTGFDYSRSVAVNDGDTVIGEAYDFSADYRAVRWNRDGTATLLPLPPGVYFGSQARAINNAGEIVGDVGNVPLRWDRDGHVMQLDTLGGGWSSPQAINDSGIAVGYGQDSAGRSRALKWDRQGHVTDLGTLGGAHSQAVAINAKGEVLGTSSTSDGTTVTVRWDSSGRITGLPEIDYPQAINDRGDVLGRTALWSPGGRITRLAPLADGEFADANGMNDDAVVGLSSRTTENGSVYHAVLWPLRKP
ncbi:hypothetical protein [Amycolatopsis sp. cg9]|uniref:hypothetical protein n=1 Tax=Amycolatopsis sp. cg9 TaxID=3238801 RepID=UPI003524B91B